MIVPTYNEELRISLTLENIVNYLISRKYEWEIIVADDGSSDRTTFLVKLMVQKDLLI